MDLEMIEFVVRITAKALIRQTNRYIKDTRFACTNQYPWLNDHHYAITESISNFMEYFHIYAHINHRSIVKVINTWVRMNEEDLREIYMKYLYMEIYCRAQHFISRDDFNLATYIDNMY